VVDCHAMTRLKSSSRSRSTLDIVILEPEKGQEVRMNELVTEADVEEGVKSELCDRYDTVSFSYARAVSVTVDVV
jgi:hypothetical protein